MKNRHAFHALLTGIAETYRQPFSEAMFGIWWECLAPYDDDVVKRAVYAHITDPEKGVFFPKPADIIGRSQDVIRADRIQRQSKAALQLPDKRPRPSWVDRLFRRYIEKSAAARLSGEPFTKEQVHQLIEDAKREQHENEQRSTTGESDGRRE